MTPEERRLKMRSLQVRIVAINEDISWHRREIERLESEREPHHTEHVHLLAQVLSERKADESVEQTRR